MVWLEGCRVRDLALYLRFRIRGLRVFGAGVLGLPSVELVGVRGGKSSGRKAADLGVESLGFGAS